MIRKHLNWTWIAGTSTWYISVFFGSMVVACAAYLFWNALNIWILREKGHSWAWFVIPISALLLTTKERRKAKGTNDNVCVLGG